MEPMNSIPPPLGPYPAHAAPPPPAAARPGGVFPVVPVVPPPLPEPVDYVGVTRPGRRWWRLPLSLVLFAAIYAAAVLILTMGFAVVGVVAGWDPSWFMTGLIGDEGLSIGPGSLLYVNLSLAILIPAAMISTRVAQGTRWGFIHSVAGRFRWGLFGQLLLVILPVWLLYLLIVTALAGGLSTGPDLHPQLWGMLAVVWLTTGLQCAGEEYAFRGWLLQNVGGLFGVRILAWGIPVALSAILFGLAHGSMDPWILGSLMIFAAATGILTWRSGGLEAAIALHTLNNMLVMHLTLIMGGFDESFIGADTSSTFPDLVATLIGHAIVVAVVWWWLKRRGVVNTTTVDPRVPRLLRLVPARVDQPINSA